MSVEVPPTSQQSRLPSPSASPSRVLEIVPGGGAGEDDAERLLERLVPGQQRRRAVGEVELAVEAELAQVAVELRSRSRVKMSFMRTSTTVVEARAYSLASGEISEEIEIATSSPSTSRASSRSRSSCAGLT